MLYVWLCLNCEWTCRDVCIKGRWHHCTAWSIVQIHLKLMFTHTGWCLADFESSSPVDFANLHIPEFFAFCCGSFFLCTQLYWKNNGICNVFTGMFKPFLLSIATHVELNPYNSINGQNECIYIQSFIYYFQNPLNPEPRDSNYRCVFERCIF